MSVGTFLGRAARAVRRRAAQRATILVRMAGLRPHVESEDRSYWEERGHRYLDEVRSILDPADPYHAAQQDFLAMLGAATWGSILEVGCGFGWHTRAVAAAFPDRRAVGVDFSLSQLVKGKEHVAGTRAQLAQADAGRLPFADGSFDIVFTSGLLMCIHPDRLAAMIAELRRVARQAVIVMEVAQEHVDTPARRAIARRAGWHCHSYGLALADAGLRVDAGYAFPLFGPERVPMSLFRGIKD